MLNIDSKFHPGNDPLPVEARIAGSLALPALIANGTMSAEVAAILWLLMEEHPSVLVVALPRKAGKSTVLEGLLAFTRPGTRTFTVRGPGESFDFVGRIDRTDSYVICNEFSRAPVPSYVWGDPVRRVFDLMERGFPVAAAMHAPTLDEALEILRSDSLRLSDRQLGHLRLAVLLRMGDDGQDTWRRVAAVREIDGSDVGGLQQHDLCRWDPATDSWPLLSEPHLQRADWPEELNRRASLLAGLAAVGLDQQQDVRRRIEAYYTGGA
ncbi:MAG: hypothetical protein HYY05_07285 [Chloroflexi bacterium]|nr:hypothetical protein [Chloroflexota bacterium]